MKFTLKNVKVMESLSEETTCFTATVYVDGVRAFEISNRGCGGCHEYHAFSEESRKMLNAAHLWAQEQPEIVSDIVEPDGKRFTYKPDLDHFVDAELTAVLHQKDLKRHLKFILLLHDGKLKPLTAKADKLNEAVRAQIQAKFEGARIVNDLPFDEAMKVYLVHG